MRKILFALCGTMALVLLALSPASAQPFYESDLICAPGSADHGYVRIANPSGDLFVHLQTVPPKPGEVLQCEIACGGFSSFIVPCSSIPVKSPVCRTGRNGAVSCIRRGLGNFGGTVCENPSVHVFNNTGTIDCTSGYRTP